MILRHAPRSHGRQRSTNHCGMMTQSGCSTFIQVATMAGSLVTSWKSDFQTDRSMSVSHTPGVRIPTRLRSRFLGSKLTSKNLQACLQRARQVDVARPLWVDYLCISQENLDEKAAQVQIIGKIFSGAGKVISWLDHPSIHHESLALPNSSTQTGIIACQNDEVDDRTHQDVMSRNEYWTRTWVIQEVVLARSVELWNCCGSISWEPFCGALENNPKSWSGPFGHLSLTFRSIHKNIVTVQCYFQSTFWSFCTPFALPGAWTIMISCTRYCLSKEHTTGTAKYRLTTHKIVPNCSGWY